MWSSDGEGLSWQIVNSTWTMSQRIFPNAASSSSGSLYVAGGLAGFDRFFGSMYKSDDGGITWVDVTSSEDRGRGEGVLPMQAFESAMGHMQELNGCMVVVGGYTRTGSAFSYLDQVWRASP